MSAILRVRDSDGNVIEIPALIGPQGDKGDKGDTGADGADGADGTSVTVSSVSESTADGGSNVVTFSDGKTLTVKNGTKGTAGTNGTNGTNGTDGADGADGADGKSAYEYAQDGGYTGTEEEFAAKLASETKENLYSIGKRIINGDFSKIIMMGDSITDGYGGSDYNGTANDPLYAISTNTEGYCFANAFKQFVEERFGITVENKGQYGARASMQVEQAQTYLTGNELVIWLTGTNNSISENDFNDYTNNLGNYIRTIKANCSELLVMSCIPMSESKEADRYKTTQDICDTIISIVGDSYFLDMRNLYIEYCEQHNINIENTFIDDVHPNDGGYLIIFKLLCKKIGISLSPYINYGYGGGWWITPVKYTNLVPTSIDTDGSVFNGVGYKTGYRVSSSGAIKTGAADVGVCTGFIAATSGDIMRVKNATVWTAETASVQNAVAVYNSSFSWLGTHCFQDTETYTGGTSYGIFTSSPITDIANGVTTIQIPANSNIAYVIISGYGDGSKMVVTRNEEIN